MMGVSCSKVSAVILTVDALAAITAEIFNTVNLGVENGGKINGRQFDHIDQPQLVSWLFLYKNWGHPILCFNSGAYHGKEAADFSQTSIHPQRACETKEWVKQYFS